MENIFSIPHHLFTFDIKERNPWGMEPFFTVHSPSPLHFQYQSEELMGNGAAFCCPFPLSSSLSVKSEEFMENGAAAPDGVHAPATTAPPPTK